MRAISEGFYKGQNVSDAFASADFFNDRRAYNGTICDLCNVFGSFRCANAKADNDR